tara:strand:- start:731 stop:1957 length:1227 start_codon:yes stop_codon:yes gene_type:complete
MWKTVKLDDICEVITKGTTPTSVGFKFENDGINFVKVESIYSDGTFLPSKFSKISKDCHLALKRSQLFEGDILFSIAGALGRTAIVTKDIVPANTNQALAILRLKSDADVDKKFLLYALNSDGVKEQSNTNKGGVAQQNLSLTQLKNYLILLPPLAEQQGIVAKLDRAFAEIEKTIKVIEDKRIKSFEIFNNLLSSIFKNNNLSWEKQKLINITLKIGSGATPRGGQNSYKEEGISLIRSMNVHDMHFKYKNLAKIDEEQAKKLSNVNVEKNDVLLNITGASVARCCVVDKDILPARVNQHVSIIRVKENTVLPKLLAYGLISKPLKDKLLEVGNSGGATRQAITKKQIEDFLFSYPSNKDMQINLINKIDSIFQQTKKLTEIFEKKITQYNFLKTSILNKNLKSESA